MFESVPSSHAVLPLLLTETGFKHPLKLTIKIKFIVHRVQSGHGGGSRVNSKCMVCMFCGGRGQEGHEAGGARPCSHPLGVCSPL